MIEEICVSPGRGAPMLSLPSVAATKGAGLAGDRYSLGRGFWQDDRVSRDLTLIEAEVVEEVAETSGVAIAARDLRRNVVTRGVDLNALVGKAFWVGGVPCIGTELCEPCRHLEEVTGLSLLRPLVHRGGLRSRILASGTLRVGDEIAYGRVDEGVGVVVSRGRDVLLGRRLSQHGRGTWSLPGGKPDGDETAIECALRELREETGLEARSAKTVGESLDGFIETRTIFHTTFVQVDELSGEPRALEPEKTARWDWHDWSNLPAPLFAPVAALRVGGFSP